MTDTVMNYFFNRRIYACKRAPHCGYTVLHVRYVRIEIGDYRGVDYNER